MAMAMAMARHTESNLMMSDSKKPLNWWVLPILFFVVHLIAVHVFASNSADITGPRADAGSMVWILWMMIDFPVGFLSISIAEDQATNRAGVWVIAILGSLQWMVWGWMITDVIRSIQSRSVDAV